MDYKEKLKAIINSDNTPFVDIDTFLKYFPELKESDDEKIMKSLRKCFEWLRDDARWTDVYGISFNSIFAWLEKKCGQGSTDKVEPKFKVGQTIKKESFNLGFTIVKIKDGFYYNDVGDYFPFTDQDNWVLIEQKPANKVEPKFKVGDWIKHNKANFIFQINKVTANNYEFNNLDGNNYSLSIKSVNKNYHVWTIQNAKDVDVLAADLIKGYSSPFVAIYKERGLDFFNSYCFVSFDGIFFKEGCTGHDTRVHPATKEQRDQLEKAMADAGYTFDFEKKELKKIEQKLAWSEEDERNLQDIDSVLFYDKCISENTCMRLRNWLKSLKDRYIWKPSDEQMEALLYEVNAWNEDSINGQNLKSLYQDLKKLREE